MLTEFLIMRSSVCVTADRTRPIIRNYSRSRRLALVFFFLLFSADRRHLFARPLCVVPSTPIDVTQLAGLLFFFPHFASSWCWVVSVVVFASLDPLGGFFISFCFCFFLRHVTRAASAYRSRRQRCDGCHALARRKWPGVAVNRSQSL